MYEVNKKLDWIFDCGCSDHIINDEIYLKELVGLKKPIHVKVGNCKTLRGTKVGKISTYFIVGFNVFFVKDMDKDLESFSKVTN